MNNDSNHVKFISYTGEWPSLCLGTLTLEVNGRVYKLDHVLASGGTCIITDTHDETTSGDWLVLKDRLPIEIRQYYEEICLVVNKNVKHGCCGGCV